jgi:hypothetical protein
LVIGNTPLEESPHLALWNGLLTLRVLDRTLVIGYGWLLLAADADLIEVIQQVSGVGIDAVRARLFELITAVSAG